MMSFTIKETYSPKKKDSVVAFVLLTCFTIPNTAFADLTIVPGMNEAQASTATMIQDICPRMGAIQSSLTTSQTALFEKCRALVQTSNEQQGAGDTAFSLGYDEAQLRNILPMKKWA